MNTERSSEAIYLDAFSGKGGGAKFEEFCRDLLTAQGYPAELVSTGSDAGKDIFIYDRAKGETLEHPEIVCIAECKSRLGKNKKSINLNDLRRNAWAMLEDQNLSCLSFYTTHKFTHPTVSCFININKAGRIRVSWFDKDDLIPMAAKHPGLWKRYFSGEPPIQQDSHGPNLNINKFPLNRLKSTDNYIDLGFRLLEPWSGEAQLRVNGQIQAVQNIKDPGFYRFHVGPFEPEKFTQSTDIDLAISTDQENEPAVFIPVEKEHGDQRISLDHILADPDQIVPQAVQKLLSGAVAMIKGTAGVGKSRFIREICKAHKKPSTYLEYSPTEDHQQLFSVFIKRIFGLHAEQLSSLPVEFIQRIGAALNCHENSIQQIAFFCSEVRHDSNGNSYPEVNFHQVSQALVEMMPDDLGLLAIDNIQWMGDLDFIFLKSILSSQKKVGLLLGSRTEKEDEKQREQDIRHLINSDHLWITEVDGKSVQLRIQEFSKSSALNENTKTLLLGLRRGRSFQEFMSALKALRQLRVLSVQENGKIEAHEELPPLQLDDYDELQNLIITSRLDAETADFSKKVIQAAAVFGFRFPVDYIVNLFGEEGAQALDHLYERELIKLEDHEGLYGATFAFDHVLTWKSIYNTIGAVRRLDRHKDIADYILTPIDDITAQQFYDAAYHRQMAKQYKDALELWDEGAQKFFAKHRISETQTGLMNALTLFSSIPFADKTPDVIEDELRIREHYLDNALLIHPPLDIWERQISAYRIDVENYTAASDIKRRRGKALCFQACFYGYRRKLAKAWPVMKESLECLKPLQDQTAYANSLKWALNIKKNTRQYDEAEKMGLKAFKIFYDNGDLKAQGETALELYHAYAEGFQFDNAHEWVLRARDAYGSFHHPGLIARTHIEEARVLAMQNEYPEKVKDVFDIAIESAKRYSLGSHIARATMNLAIYQASRLKDLHRAHELFEEAARTLKDYPNDYQQLLLGFSQLILVEPINENALADSAFGEQLVRYCEGYESLSHIGDQRMQAMLKVMAAGGNEAVIRLIRESAPNEYEQYVDIGLGDEFTQLVTANPIFLGWRCLLYY